MLFQSSLRFLSMRVVFILCLTVIIGLVAQLGIDPHVGAEL
jgi:hypothetical protein